MATLTLQPNGPGDETAIPTLVGAATHWQAVLTNDGDTSYVEAPVNPAVDDNWYRDLYAIEGSSDLGAISEVRVMAYGRHTLPIDAGSSPCIKLCLKTHSTVYEIFDFLTGYNYDPASATWTTNPYTGDPFTWDEINELQAGVSLKRSHRINERYWKARSTLVSVAVTYTPAVSAQVTTDAATLVAENSATLPGTLDNDGGMACDCGFEYGETVAYGNTTPTQSRTTGQTFSQDITGLDPNKTYHFRAFATNAAGTSYGADRTFTTLVALPTTTTDPATSVATTTATLNGTLDDDGGEACDCGFQWGETIAYGNTTPTQSRTTGQTFAQAIAGLDPNKTYHFRAETTNSRGTSYGTDRTFVTLAVLPTVTTDPATDSILNGTLDDDGGMACDCGFQWGLTVAYGNTTPTQSRTTGQTFWEILGGLVPGTTYHYRAFATNGAGTSYGADRTFALPAGLPVVTTSPATGIGMIRAALNGTLDDDGGEICECGFEWGADITYGLTPPTESKITGETFSQLIRGLFPGRVYHFRAFATNSHGTAYGDDESFYTKPSVSRAYALAREEL